MNLLSVISEKGFSLKKVSSTKGGEYAGPCPNCGGFDRFRCWPEGRGGSGSYWCRQCGKWGDNVQFLVDFCGYNYREAFKAVGREVPDTFTTGQWIPDTKPTLKAFEPKSHEQPGEIWQEKATRFVNHSHECLLKSDNALSFLDNRGLDIFAVRTYKLGYFPGENKDNCMFRPRSSWGLPQIKKANGKDKMLWLPRGIVIPCFMDGNIYRIRIRRPKADLQKKGASKYYIVPGSGMEAMSFKLDHQALVIVESELDAMMISRQAGNLCGVVALGSASSKPGAYVYPYLKKALRILVALDFDDAGLKACSWWRQHFRSARQWPVPVNKDPGEAYEHGLNIKEWIKAGLPPVLTLEFPSRHNPPPGLKPPEGLYPIDELRFFLKSFP